MISRASLRYEKRAHNLSVSRTLGQAIAYALLESDPDPVRPDPERIRSRTHLARQFALVLNPASLSISMVSENKRAILSGDLVEAFVKTV